MKIDRRGKGRGKFVREGRERRNAERGKGSKEEKYLLFGEKEERKERRERKRRRECEDR